MNKENALFAYLKKLLFFGIRLNAQLASLANSLWRQIPSSTSR